MTLAGTPGEIAFHLGLPEALREAAGLYSQAFGRKLSPFLVRGDRRVALLARGVRPGFAVAAVAGDELAEPAKRQMSLADSARGRVTLSASASPMRVTFG